jgi:hypothetical protein
LEIRVVPGMEARVMPGMEARAWLVSAEGLSRSCDEESFSFEEDDGPPSAVGARGGEENE